MILSNDMHLPSAAKLWHIPTPPTVFPTPLPSLRLTVPLDEHDTSYFAAAARIFSLPNVSSVILPVFVVFALSVHCKYKFSNPDGQSMSTRQLINFKIPALTAKHTY